MIKLILFLLWLHILMAYSAISKVYNMFIQPNWGHGENN